MRTIAALYVQTDVIARLNARIKHDPDAGCLTWTGYRNPKGYGTINVAGTPVYAHRLSWENANGPIPEGKCILHKCDNPPCCNPDHLFLGTRAENNADMVAKGRARQGASQAAKTHCKRGHAFTADNTRVYRGKRHCRACERDWRRKARAEGRAK